MTETVNVSLDARAYDVHVGAGLLACAGELIAPFAPTGRVFVITDKNVAKKHLPTLTTSLEAAGLTHAIIKMAPGEGSKSFEGLESALRQLLKAGVNRKDLVIAFGGGVIGDLAGLAAGLTPADVAFAFKRQQTRYEITGEEQVGFAAQIG